MLYGTTAAARPTGRMAKAVVVLNPLPLSRRHERRVCPGRRARLLPDHDLNVAAQQGHQVLHREAVHLVVLQRRDLGLVDAQSRRAACPADIPASGERPPSSSIFLSTRVHTCSVRKLGLASRVWTNPYPGPLFRRSGRLIELISKSRLGGNNGRSHSTRRVGAFSTRPEPPLYR